MTVDMNEEGRINRMNSGNKFFYVESSSCLNELMEAAVTIEVRSLV